MRKEIINSNLNSKLPKLLIKESFSLDTSPENLNVRQDRYFAKPKLQRIIYPPSQSRNKENKQYIMLQSCIQHKKYEDVWDENNQNKIKRELGPLVEESRAQILLAKHSPLIGKDATLKYYDEYKKLDKTLLKRAFSKDFLNQLGTTNDPLNFMESSSISMLEQTENLKVLPLCLGIIKSRGQTNVINLNNYNLGDRYISAMSAGLKNAKMIQKCLLSKNRITDIGLMDLMNNMNQQITTLDLSHNKITKVDKKLLDMIFESEYRLEHLNIASNRLREQSVQLIFRNIRYSNHLKYLNIGNNKLTLNCLDALCEMLQKCTTLEELYIGSNYISAKGGEKIFHVLSNNKFLKVLDYSFNLLGEDDNYGLGCAKSISHCFKYNKYLQHIDLSFNSFNLEASTIIAEGLQYNKYIYGIHYRGNYGYINSKGFLMLQEKQLTTLHTIEDHCIDSFEVTSIRQRHAFESENYKNVCWICEGWYEQQFKFSVPADYNQEKLLVFIHFDFEKYSPRLINLTQRVVKYITMVPPKKYHYFYTFNNQICLDSYNEQAQTLPISEDHSYQMDHTVRNFKVERVNWKTGKPQRIVNEWHELIVKSQPRMNGLMTKKEKEPWVYNKSVWSKEWKLQDEDFVKKCFEKDWKNTKIMNLIKNQADQEKVKEKLSQNYTIIKNIYRQFSSWSPFGDIWAVSSQPFTQFCQQAKIINKDTPLKIIDLTFITTNSLSGSDWKGNSLVPQRGLVRFQFMQSLVRLAEQKFKKIGVTDNFADSVGLMLKDHIQPLGVIYNSDKWRLQKYFCEENDILIKKFRSIFSVIYKRNSKLKLKPGEKPFMCLAEFKSIIQRANLSNYLTQRDIFVSFNTSMMTQIDELENERFIKMTEIEFIEATARCANLLPNNCCVEPPAQGPTPLHYKFEWMVYELKNCLCPEDIRSQFPDPQGKSIFTPEEE